MLPVLPAEPSQTEAVLGFLYLAEAKKSDDSPFTNYSEKSKSRKPVPNICYATVLKPYPIHREYFHRSVPVTVQASAGHYGFLIGAILTQIV